MKVERVTIVRDRYGPDTVFLHTDLPNPMWPWTGNLYVKFDCARNQGPEYVKETFDLEAKLIEVDA